MRVCLVSNEIAPFNGSGIGVYAADAARAWAAAGHETHIITGDHAGIAERAGALLPGVRIHTIDLAEDTPACLPEPRGAVHWPLGAFERLRRLHAESPLDYAEFPDFGGEGYFAIQARTLLPGRPESLPGCVLGVRLHMPSVLINATNHRTWRGRHREYVAQMERTAIAGADVVWAPCRAVVESLRSMGVAVADSPERPVLVSANPFVPIARPIPPASPGADGAPEIVFVGRLERRKGPEVLVRAAIDVLRERPGARVRLIGGDTDTGPLDGSVCAWLEGMIPAGLRDRIVLEGNLPRERCVAAMASAAAVCFPAHWDNWPYAALEAMSLGACIVASDAGGHAEMLEHDRTALLTPAGDARALAAALRRAIDEPALRARLGSAARDRALHLGDPARFARETMDRVAQIGAAARAVGTTARRGTPAANSMGPAAVTVVIPHKDMPDFLPDALASLDAQTVHGFTVLLVDDDSTSPRAIDLLDRLERQTGTGRFDLKILRGAADLRGPAAARNRGIAAASTPLIVTLDADDALSPTHLEKCLAAMNASPVLACLGTLVSYFDEHPDRPTGSWAPLGLIRDMLPAMNTMGTGSGIMFRREVLAALRPALPGGGPFDPGIPGYEDWDLYCALAGAGHRGQILPEALTHYRVRPDSRYHGNDRRSHDRLVAELAARHPGLAEHPDVAMRLLIAEGRARQQPMRRRLRKLRRERKGMRRRLARLQERLDALRARLERARPRRRTTSGRPATSPPAPLPLRYRAADRAAGLLRRAGLSGSARRILSRLGRRSSGPRA